jgi:hypothetical protein
MNKTDEIIETLIKEQTEALLRNRQELAKRRENEKERLRVIRHAARALPEKKAKPPNQREKRWFGIIVREVVHAKLRELSKFYGKPVTRIIEDWTEEAFIKALAQIEKTKK